jgi:putative ABC transport system ATP-binding protein
MIKLKNIQKVYRTETVETLALNNINFEVQKGEFIAIMGPSGCGKSTLLNVMGLLDVPTEGEVYIEGNPIVSFSDKELSRVRNQKIGFIFQSYHLINDLTVIENVELPLLYAKFSRKERRYMASEALERVGLANRLKHYPEELSGGQRQRVAIARAVVGKPSLILADEPTGNLDSKMGNEVMDLLEKLNKEENMTLVMVTHDEKMALKADKIINLLDGTLAESALVAN